MFNTALDPDEFEAIGRKFAQEGHPAWILATQVTHAQDVPMAKLRSVWVDEWTDEDETWGVALNGTGEDRHWHGRLYTDPTDQVVAIEHPAGTGVVGIDDQAIAVVKPDGCELFCDRDATKIWERAVIYALRDRCVDLGMDLPPVDEFVRERGGEDDAE